MMKQNSLQLMFSKFEYDGKLNETFVEGPFELPVSSIKAYINDPITPRYIALFSGCLSLLLFFIPICLIFCCVSVIKICTCELGGSYQTGKART